MPVLVAAGLWNEVSVRKARTYASLVAGPDHPGALVRQPGFEFWGNPDAAVVPSLVALPQDLAAIEGATCRQTAHNNVLEICSSPVSPPTTKQIVVVGDSHL